MQRPACSPYNREGVPRLPRRITVYDTTLRDGEQMAGVSFTPARKLCIARLLDGIGVPQIEAGFPAVSADELRAVRAVSRAGLEAEVLCLSRLRREDIEAAQAAEADAVLLFIATSPLHLRYKLRMSESQVLEAIPEALDLARSMGLRASFTPEDSTRTRLPFLRKALRTAVAAGAWRVGLADTLGCINPQGIRHLVRRLRPLTGTPFTLHLHNDFGLALANALAGLEEGADAVATTVAGFGERSGNVPLEQLVSALKFLYGKDIGIRTGGLTPLAATVSRLARVPLPANAPLVGEGVFTHKAGIHIAGVLREPSTYEPVPPGAVGNRRRFVLGKQSGRAAVRALLSAGGRLPSESEVERLLRSAKRQNGRERTRAV
ncbi:MAG: homoaconitate hydratase [Euryarchaeota archaeon]|nr:homoaconitate hydratase [Euryarchaeota archaeon]